MGTCAQLRKGVDKNSSLYWVNALCNIYIIYEKNIFYQLLPPTTTSLLHLSLGIYILNVWICIRYKC